MMISVHEWNTEPRLCVIFGAEEVATYQFRCRSPFTIGTRNFLADGVTEEQHEAVVLDMVRGKEFVCSQGAMAEIFEESEMVLLYRFSMEIEKAKNSLDLNLGPTIEAADHIVPNVGNTGTGNRIGGDGGRGSLGNTYGESSKQVNEGPTAQLAGVGNNENTLQAPDVEGNTGRNASQG
ncbi:unnamed protein product [Brassica rapa subsp. trilocularis]